MSAFDQAFALLKMPIDWDTVTEPVWTQATRKLPRSAVLRDWKEGDPDYPEIEVPVENNIEGEASAQWIHPKTGERYNIRMDKWQNKTLVPDDEDLARNPEALPYSRLSGSMTVTKPMEEERANALAEAMGVGREYLAESEEDQERWGGLDFYNAVDPFGEKGDYNITSDERVVPMPDIDRTLFGLGLGTDMYDLLHHWGMRLKPDDNQSRFARRLWARNQGYDRDTADMMATGIPKSSSPYQSLLREAVRRVRAAGLHPSLDFDPTMPTGVVGLLNIWDAMGYEEGTEIKNWLNDAVRRKGLAPFAENRPFLPPDPAMEMYDKYEWERPNWTWRGHNERN
jgi:hypothetical protein